MAHTWADENLFTRPTGTHAVAQTLFLAGLTVSLVHLTLILIGLDGFSLLVVTSCKGLTVALFALAAITWRHDLTGYLASLAFLACATGDVLILLPISDAFQHALKAVSVGHVLFIIVFLVNRESMQDISSVKARVASLLWSVMIVLLFFAYPHIRDADTLVTSHVIAMAVMVTTALMSRFPGLLVGLGAVLYLLSDSLLLAVQLDFEPLTGYQGVVDLVVWALYIAGQVLLLMGIMVGRPRRYFHKY